MQRGRGVHRLYIMRENAGAGSRGIAVGIFGRFGDLDATGGAGYFVQWVRTLLLLLLLHLCKRVLGESRNPRDFSLLADILRPVVPSGVEGHVSRRLGRGWRSDSFVLWAGFLVRLDSIEWQSRDRRAKWGGGVRRRRLEPGGRERHFHSVHGIVLVAFMAHCAASLEYFKFLIILIFLSRSPRAPCHPKAPGRISWAHTAQKHWLHQTHPLQQSAAPAAPLLCLYMDYEFWRQESWIRSTGDYWSKNPISHSWIKPTWNKYP